MGLTRVKQLLTGICLLTVLGIMTGAGRMAYLWYDTKDIETDATADFDASVDADTDFDASVEVDADVDGDTDTA